MGIVLITGCSRATGFGQLTALAFARAGHSVYATMRNSERSKSLLDTAAAQDLNVHVLDHDVTDPASNRSVVSVILAREGKIDVLVNNAGIAGFGALETLHDNTIRSVMETNFFGTVDLTRAVLPVMREQSGGRIVFVTSLAGRFGVPGETAYSASKFALEGLAEGLAYEVKRFGIQISLIEPGFFDTGMSAENTAARDQFSSNPAYDAFNAQMVASTEAGENAGENPQLVADMVVEAATTQAPELRWLPGKAAPAIAAAHKRAEDAQWHAGMIDELQLRWWVEGESAPTVADE